MEAKLERLNALKGHARGKGGRAGPSSKTPGPTTRVRKKKAKIAAEGETEKRRRIWDLKNRVNSLRMKAKVSKSYQFLR